MKRCVVGYLICLCLSAPAPIWAQTPPPSPTPGYFESHYNPVPNTGGPNQLKMLGTWGYYTDTGGYSNNYHPAIGDEVGAFWNNGTDDILVGAATIDSGMAGAGAYATLDIFGRDPDYPGGLSSGLVNGSEVLFKVYLQSRSAEYDGDPALTFQGGDPFHQHDLAVDLPPSPIPPPTATPTAKPTHTPTPTLAPTATPTPAGLLLAARVFLQGPYDSISGGMLTALLDDGYLPLTSPYTDGRVVPEIPEGVVDWVYLELRQTSDGAAVSARSAFVDSAGSLMDDGGGGEVLMDLPAGGEGDYYIVVRHRDHLAVMSAVPHYLEASGATEYDFTTGQDRGWGTSPMKELATGVYGLFTGDADGSGVVDGQDRVLIYGDRGLVGYRVTDVDLTGVVDGQDRVVTYGNRGRVSLAP